MFLFLCVADWVLPQCHMWERRASWQLVLWLCQLSVERGCSVSVGRMHPQAVVVFHCVEQSVRAVQVGVFQREGGLRLGQVEFRIESTLQFRQIKSRLVNKSCWNNVEQRHFVQLIDSHHFVNWRQPWSELFNCGWAEAGRQCRLDVAADSRVRH